MKGRIGDMIGASTVLLIGFLAIWVLAIAPVIQALAG